MAVFIKHGGLNQYIWKCILDGSSPHTNCGKEFLAACLVGSNITGQYTGKITNNAWEWTHCRFEFKCDTNIARKILLSNVKVGFISQTYVIIPSKPRFFINYAYNI
jgi:hypothetical protein